MLSVAALLGDLRARISGGAVVVEGEVGNLFRSQKGHLYFDLQDLEIDAQLRCVAFASRLTEADAAGVQEGARVRVLGRSDVYAPRGSLQLVAERLWPAGEGALRLALARLQARLEAEGLFDAEHKRPLPPFPARIGLVTSVQGAAIHDFLKALRMRGASLEVLVYDARVQGPGAWRELVRGLHLLASRGVEVLVLARGGGSFEDLLEFNREELVRAIFALETPVISAVGHEVDVTLADRVADARAATPTAAAELVAPDMRALSERLERARRRLAARVRERVDRLGQRLRLLRRGLVHPRVHLRTAERRLVELDLRMRRAAARVPQRERARLESLGARLDALSPLSVLARGYGVVRRLSDGAILRDAREVDAGARIDVRLARGRLLARVDESRER